VATNFCRNYVFVGFIHRIGFALHSVDGGVQLEVQVQRWAQANQLTHQLRGGEGHSRAGYIHALPCS